MLIDSSSEQWFRIRSPLRTARIRLIHIIGVLGLHKANIVN